ncbi:MAG: glycosyltransferase [Bradymonadaceae bacterium]
MKIAFYIGTFPALSETFILNQITGLIDRGHDVHIFAARPAVGSKSHPDVDKYDLLSRTHYWPTPGEAIGHAVAIGPRRVTSLIRATLAADVAWSAAMFGRALTVERAGAFDAVLCHFGHLGREAQVLRDIGALRGKLLTVFHGYDMSVFLRERGERVYDHLFAHADLLLPISDHWRRKLIGLGADENRTRIHRMGIDCARFEFRPRHPDPDGLVHVVTIGRLTEKKGIRHGVEAIARLVEKHPNVRYHIVGDGDLRSDIESLVASLGVEGVVEMHGWMDGEEILSLLQGQHILLTPSITAANGDTEGIPVVLMEGMAMGLPVVSTLHSGIPELVRHEHSGYLVAESDVDDLTMRLEHLLDHPETWPELGAQGRRIVEEDFDIDRLNDGLVEILANL